MIMTTLYWNPWLAKIRRGGPVLHSFAYTIYETHFAFTRIFDFVTVVFRFKQDFPRFHSSQNERMS